MAPPEAPPPISHSPEGLRALAGEQLDQDGATLKPRCVTVNPFCSIGPLTCQALNHIYRHYYNEPSRKCQAQSQWQNAHIFRTVKRGVPGIGVHFLIFPETFRFYPVFYSFSQFSCFRGFSFTFWDFRSFSKQFPVSAVFKKSFPF